MMWDNANGYEERDRRQAPPMPTPSIPITMPPGTATSAQFAPASFPQSAGAVGGFVPPSTSYNYANPSPTYQAGGYTVYQPQVQWPQMQSYPGQQQPGQPITMQQSYSEQYTARVRKHSHSGHSRSRSHSHSHSRNHSHSRHRTHSHSSPQPQVIIAQQPPSPNPILRPSQSQSQLPQVIQVSGSHHHHHHKSSHKHSHSQPQILIAQQPSPQPQPILHASHSFSHMPPNAQPIVVPANAVPGKRIPPKKYTSAKLHKISRLPNSGSVFQYSKCTGKRKALCIGINYLGQQNELRGCINDARHVRDFLIEQWRYRPGDIVILTDDSQIPRQQPTRKNIIEAMKWLVRDARPHDSLFFHYSGHGGQTKDLNGDEMDGYDEVIYPVDFKKTQHIIDDEMHELMVKPLPAGCRLTALFDSCHSGTILDLAYVYSSHGRLKGSQITPAVRDMLASPADVITWSGCKDGQTSADTFHGGVAVGAMSWAFIQSLKQNPNQSYDEFLRSLRRILNPKFDQIPQLGSSHRIDTSLRFIM